MFELEDPSLSLPSLYDFIVSQEKLAVEIRKQNKEVRSLSQECLHMKEWLQEVHSSLMSLGKQEEEEPIPVVVDETVEILMETMDGVWNLLKGSRETLQAILSVVPQKIRFWKRRPSDWRLRLEEILEGYRGGIEAFQQKAALALAQVGISLISPEEGDLFDPQLHRAIKVIEPGRKRTVVEVVRLGYLKEAEILRYAEVIIC